MSRTSFHTGWTVWPKVSPFASLSGSLCEAEEVTLPHDAVWALQRSADSPDAGRVGFFPGGAFEYAKTFDAPADWADKRVSLEFQGVYRDAMVFLNGAFVAQRPYGYSTFVVPLDDWLRPGEPNTIRVDARSHGDSRWYSGAGIHRDVYLVVDEGVHVPPHGVRVATPDIDDERAVVDVVTEVVNATTATTTVRVRTEVLDAAGDVVAEDTAPATVRPGVTRTVRQRLYVMDPQRWNVDAPVLYSLRTTLSDGDGTTETLTSFGIRSLQLDPQHGLRINGTSVKLRGACIHHDNGPLGAAAIGAAEERRVRLLKAAGFNAIRSAHNPISQAMLDACDRIGMLVMDEAFDMWTEAKSSFDYSLAFPEWWERDLEAMVRKDLNHPCVIMYSIGNEIFETGRPAGGEWSWRLAETVRRLDPTRFVTNGINGFVSILTELPTLVSTWQGAESGGINAAAEGMSRVNATEAVTERTAESFAALDVAGMNYADSRYALDLELFPNRVIVGSETYPTQIANTWGLVRQYPHVIGDFTWTGWDYLGEVGIGRPRYADASMKFEAEFPWLTAWCGDIDITGERRPASYYREIVFGLRREPFIAVRRPETHHRTPAPGMWSWSDSVASWTWPVDPGSPVTVEVYSDADEVELLLNDHSCGRLPTGPEHDFRAEFEVGYTAGDLVAVAYAGGVEQARTVLATAGSVSQLVVTPDRDHLQADHRDLCFLAVELCDQDGHLVTAFDRAVTARVEGPAVLAAFGSARPDNTERFDAGAHTTFDGRALAIVRPTGPGAITVIVTSDDLRDVTVTLEAR
jgi:beta-galactosidase